MRILKPAAAFAALAIVSVFIFLIAFNDGVEIVERKQRNKPFSKQQMLRDLYKQEFEKTADRSLGFIPSQRLRKAREIMLQREQAKRYSLQKSALASAQWTERGPDNVGGRTRALMWDPNTTNKVWAGGVTGGLWYISDITSGSAQWTKVDDFWDAIGITAITYDPNDTQVFYVGTGEWWYTGDSRGEGIWKTSDGGSTWQRLQSTTGFNFVNDLVVRNESGSSVLYAAVEGGYNFGWHGFNQTGLWRSDDGGLTFTQVLPDYHVQDGSGNTHPYAVADIELGADNRIYLGTRDNNWGEGGGCILFSDTGLSGSWTVDSLTFGTITEVGRVELATAPSNANIVYAVIEANNAAVRMSISTNKAASWTTRSLPDDWDPSMGSDFTRGQGWYDLILQSDPNDDQTLYAGGINLFKSTDGAQNWTQISDWNGFFFDYVHADQHQIQFKAGSSSEIIFGTDGGVYYSSDAGGTFATRNNGYNVTQFYACAIHPGSGVNQFLAGSQDNGTQRFTSAGMNSTTEATGGDGAYTHIDQNESSYQFTSYVYNNYYRSTNGGSSFSSVDFGNTGYFINPTDYDDTNNIFYASHNVDQFLRWNNPQTGSSFTEVAFSQLGGDRVSAITVSPHTAHRVFFGSNNGKIIRADNANATPSYTVLNASAGTPSAYVNCIEIDPDDENHMLAIFSNYGVDNVWETKDGGSSWTSCEGDLPDLPVRWALFDPNNTEQALIATDLGVWSTDRLDGADTRWVPANTGQAHVRTDMLKTRSSDDLVIAATHGRGLYSSDVFSTAQAGFSADKRIAYVGQDIQFTDGSLKATSWSWDFGDGNVSTQQHPLHSYSLPGFYTVELTINGGTDTETETNYIHVMPSLGTPYQTTDGGDFESNPVHFDSEALTNGLIDVWERGTPGNALTTLNSGSNGWKTMLTEDVPDDNYTSVLYTPSYNFSAAGSYGVQFRKSMEASGANAPFGVYMEYSTDNGDTWTLLGDDISGTNWYDRGANSATEHDVTPHGYAWSGNYSNEISLYDCSFLAGNSFVAFRFVFMMAEGYTSGYNQDGFMIDDFEITGETNDTSLPVQLSAFSAEPMGERLAVELKWETASELQNAYWIIGRSENGVSFEEIARLDGHGTTSEAHAYRHEDTAIRVGSSYSYRLTDVSYSGLRVTHPAVTVDISEQYANSVIPAQYELAQNYPNPFNPSTTIRFALKESGPVKLIVYDVSGREVARLLDKNLDAGKHDVAFRAEGLSTGLYVYRLITPAYSAARKMMLMK